jgi:ssDNA-binding Zn-finger/Zn-ribbon topoisomerase 1
MKRMVEHAKHIEQECEHKYSEQVAAPLGVKCVKCGHFVGAWE